NRPYWTLSVHLAVDFSSHPESRGAGDRRGPPNPPTRQPRQNPGEAKPRTAPRDAGRSSATSRNAPRLASTAPRRARGGAPGAPRGRPARVALGRREPTRTPPTGHLNDLIAATDAAISADPANADAVFRAQAIAHDAVASTVTLGRYRVEVDEPPALGGDGA